MKKTFFKSNIMVVLLGALTITSCQENEYGSVDLSDYVKPEVPSEIVWNHPSTMYGVSDFARVKEAIANGTAAQAVKDELTALRSSAYTTGNYDGSEVHATEWITRGSTSSTQYPQNYSNAMRDAAAAYQHALLWKITGEEAHATAALNFLNTWAKVCTVGVTDVASDCVLAAGAQGFTFAAAGEMMRDYSGWSIADRTAFIQWMVDKFAAKNYKFLMYHNGVTCGPMHYWSNWDMVSLLSYLQIGILAERKDMVDFVVTYFSTSGIGNGMISKLCMDQHDDPLGSGEKIRQGQESGRDQGHAQMACMVAAQLCQVADNLYKSNPTYANLDFFSLNDYMVLQMAEYVALTNLRDGADIKNESGNYLIPVVSNIPFTPIAEGYWCKGGSNHEAFNAHNNFGDAARGTVRPSMEIFLHHFKGMTSELSAKNTGIKYIKQYADKIRPEGGAGEPGDVHGYGNNSGAFDQVGWNTLMLYQE